MFSAVFVGSLRLHSISIFMPLCTVFLFSILLQKTPWFSSQTVWWWCRIEESGIWGKVFQEEGLQIFAFYNLSYLWMGWSHSITFYGFQRTIMESFSLKKSLRSWILTKSTKTLQHFCKISPLEILFDFYRWLSVLAYAHCECGRHSWIAEFLLSRRSSVVWDKYFNFV